MGVKDKLPLLANSLFPEYLDTHSTRLQVPNVNNLSMSKHSEDRRVNELLIVILAGFQFG